MKNLRDHLCLSFYREKCYGQSHTSETQEEPEQISGSKVLSKVLNVPDTMLTQFVPNDILQMLEVTISCEETKET